MASFEERIGAETRAWVRDGIVSEAQAEAIRDRYASDRRGRLIAALATIGALAVGAGVILFFAANWDTIPKLARLAVLLLALAATLGGGEWLRTRGYPRVGEAVTLLGGLLFGAAIFLVGQMYHLDDHAGAGFLLWSLGAAAGTVVFRSSRWAALTVATLAIWLSYVVGGVDYGELIPFELGLLGLAVYAVATRLRETELLALPRVVGAAVALVPVFALTFGDVASDAIDEDLPGRVVAALAATAAAAVAAGVALALDRTRMTGVHEGAAVAIAALTLVLGTTFDVTPIVFNLLLIALAAGAILAGYANDEVWLVNLGLGAVGLELVGRFFDTFWRLLPRSAAFLVAGTLVLGVAWLLERQRSRLVARMTR